MALTLAVVATQPGAALWLAFGFVAGLAAAGVVAWSWHQRRGGGHARRAADAVRHAQQVELGLLTAGLAHEIKNPLSTLQLNLQLLAEDLDARIALQVGSDDPAADEMRRTFGRMRRRLAGVTRETVRLREILDGFLRYAGRFEPELRRVDVSQTAGELVDFLTPQAEASRVTLVPVAPPGVFARTDENLLRQALLNLVLNAIQHTPEGGRVALRVVERDGQTVISVEDTGRGIDPDDEPRVFDPYFSRRKGGTGLGLALTRRITEALGGTLSLDNRFGEGVEGVMGGVGGVGGVTFVLTLPPPAGRRRLPTRRPLRLPESPAKVRPGVQDGM